MAVSVRQNAMASGDKESEHAMMGSKGLPDGGEQRCRGAAESRSKGAFCASGFGVEKGGSSGVRLEPGNGVPAGGRAP